MIVRYRVYADGRAERHEKLHAAQWHRCSTVLTEDQQRKFAILRLASIGVPQNVAHLTVVEGIGNVYWTTKNTTVVSFYGEE